MRVLHLMAGAERGGAETFFVDAVTTLQRHGLDQHVVTRAVPDRVARLRAAGVPVTTAEFAARLRQPTRLVVRQAIETVRPTVIQAWMGRAAEYVPAGCAPAIGWFGGYYDLKRYRTCQHLVGVTRDLGEYLVRAGAPPERVHVIHTFAEPDASPAVARATQGTPDGAPLLLALARLHRHKGLDVLLDALTALPGVHLWIAGEGPLRAPLEALIRRLDLGARVHLLGWRGDRWALLRAADVLVLPSRVEPFGTVMVEAWATRTPVVAAESMGPRMYIRHGETGLLCPIDDAASLAREIRRCLDDEALRQRMIDAGYETFATGFTADRLVAEYRALYGAAAASSPVEAG